MWYFRFGTDCDFTGKKQQKICFSFRFLKFEKFIIFIFRYFLITKEIEKLRRKLKIEKTRERIPPILRLNTFRGITPRMARTKQTARKSTAGKALKKSLITAKTARKSTGSKKTATKRYRPGNTLVLREIKKYSKSTECLIKKQPFKRFVLHCLSNLGMKDTIRFKAGTLDALQEATENYVVSLAEDAYLCTRHANRVTLMPRDLNLVVKIKKNGFVETRV